MAKGSGSAGRGGGGSGSASNSRAAGTGPAALTEENIVQIALDLGAQPGRNDISVADVRAEFYARFDPAGTTTTAQFDEAVVNMQINGSRIGLMRFDHPKAGTERERRYAIDVFGDKRHLLYLRR